MFLYTAFKKTIDLMVETVKPKVQDHVGSFKAYELFRIANSLYGLFSYPVFQELLFLILGSSCNI